MNLSGGKPTAKEKCWNVKMFAVENKKGRKFGMSRCL